MNNIKNILNLDNDLTTILSTEEIEKAKKTLLIIQETFFYEVKIECNILYRGNIFFNKKSNKNRKLALSLLNNSLFDSYELPFYKFIENTKIFSLNKENITKNIDSESLFNEEFKNFLKNIEKVYQLKILSKTKNRHGKYNSPYNNFYSAVKENINNKYQRNNIIKIIYPYFDLSKGVFSTYSIEDLKNIDCCNITHEHYFINKLALCDISKENFFVKILDKIKKENININIFSISNLTNKFFKLLEVLHINTNNKSIKYYMVKHMKNFVNDNNIRLLLATNINIIDNIVTEDTLLDVNLKLKDLQYKSLKFKDDNSIILNAFLKVYLFEYNQYIKYKNNIDRPIFYYLKKLSTTSYTEEDISMFEYYVLKILFNNNAFSSPSLFFYEDENTTIANLNQLLDIKSKNISLYQYFFKNKSVLFNSLIKRFIQKYPHAYTIDCIEEYLSEKISFIKYYKIGKEDLQDKNKLEVTKLGYHNFINDNLSHFLYYKLYTYKIQTLLINRLDVREINLTKLNDFLRFNKVTPKQKYFLFLMVALFGKHIFSFIDTIYSINDKSIFNIILNTYYLLLNNLNIYDFKETSHFTINQQQNSLLNKINHNFFDVFLQLITHLIKKDFSTEIIKKIVFLIKNEVSQTLFETLNLYYIYDFENFNDNKIKKLILKSKSLKELKFIIKTSDIQIQHLYNKIYFNESLKKLINNQDAERDVIEFIKKVSPTEELIAKRELNKHLKIEIRGDKDILGHIGSTVSGVCISTTSVERYSHLNKGYMNLIVRDEDNIYLWGLLLKVTNKSSGQSSYLLNNLQGSINKKYKYLKSYIAEEIINIMKSIDNPVYIRNHSFNSMDLPIPNKLQTEEFLIDKNVRMDFFIKSKENDKFLIEGDVAKIN